ncbi:hypothetical protein GCM10027343_38750 [Noviherbaspirillum agri]
MADFRGMLQDIVITHELLRRPSRPANPHVEKLALDEIAQQTPHGRDAILHALCRLGLRLCDGGSCGINLLENSREGGHFRWVIIEGAFAPYKGGTGPVDDSPCGYVRDQNAPQLLANTARYVEWMQEIEIPVVESLIVPLCREKDEVIGTIWVVSHEEQRRFDSEDLRILSLLSNHATAALKLHESLYTLG